ncbi:MAG TPA: type II secretion system F family protein [Verrucomicrobia bacterium]|nr:type II secretion system F family protein [Verrucomicrobiota bacterium]HOB32267.1 type II secretion system F family protein [Verrucomicrobiota bacterium]HOP97601.1 type II secretion system F family protein [Verrucomicrobiota bacterium]HPU56732.1 type II secretion system F family protein [Verrucomicrobiota bacterium]
MPLFYYKALQANGTIAEGHIEAAGRPDAFRQIETMGLRPVSLAEKAAAKNGSVTAATGGLGTLSFNFKSRKVSARDLENFTRLLSSLLAAGVPLSRALVILHKEASNPVTKAKWKEVHDYVVDGMSLADAMAKSPETFPRVYTAMVQAGETGGFLDVVLQQIADFQAREKELKGKVTSAMLYPAVLLVLAVAVLAFLMVFFIPKFQKMFASYGGQLPLITQVIVGISHTIRSYGLIVAGGLVVAGLMLKNWFTSEQGRRVWETIMLKTPIVGPLAARFAMARFCRMLGTLLGAGVPLVQALNVARRSLGNQILIDAVAQSIERVQEGGRLGESLADCQGLFPSSVLEMIAVAEESGRLDAELVRIANVTEGDLDRNLRTAVALAEPAMLFMIASLIGTIFIGMLLPIFSLQDQIK